LVILLSPDGRLEWAALIGTCQLPPQPDLIWLKRLFEFLIGVVSSLSPLALRPAIA
jgi:hypothetical protein